jgi:HEAT repeat protein
MKKVKMKRFLSSSSGIIIFVFFLGCATNANYIKEVPTEPYTSASKEHLDYTDEEVEFKKIESINTIIGYQQFVQIFPHGKLTSEAKKRIADSQEDAFARTIQIGTIEAFQGFIESYPESKYNLEIEDYFAWMEKSRIGALLTFPPDLKADSLKKDVIDNLDKYQDKLGKRIIILTDQDEVMRDNLKVVISICYIRIPPRFGEITKNAIQIFGHSILLFPAAIVGLALDAVAYPSKIIISWEATIKCVNLPEKVEYEKSSRTNDISNINGFFKLIQEAEFVAWITESNIPSLELLNIAYQSGDEYFRWAILNALDRSNKNTTDLFSRALQDNSSKVRMSAAKALCNQNDPRGFTFLKNALRDKDLNVGSNAIEMLEIISNSKAAEILASALKDNEAGLQFVEMGACNKIKEPVMNKETMELFVQALGSDDLKVRFCAATVLCNQNNPRGYAILESIIQDKDDDLRVMTITALKGIKTPQAVHILVLALKDDNWGVQREAITALSEIKDTTAVKPLIDAIDRNNSYYVTSALKEITGQDFGEDKKKWQEWYDQNMIK